MPGSAGRGIGDGEVGPGLGQQRVLEDDLAGDGVDVAGVQGVEDRRHVVVGDDRAGLAEEVDPGVNVDALFLDVDDEGVQLGPVDQVEEAVEIVPVVHGRVEIDRLGRELIGGSIGRAGESRAQSRGPGKGRSGEPLQGPAPREGRNRTYSRTGAHPVVPHTPVPLSSIGFRVASPRSTAPSRGDRVYQRGRTRRIQRSRRFSTSSRRQPRLEHRQTLV